MKIDTMIENLAYIHDCLITLQEIQSSGDCNICKVKKCKYRPKMGEMVRYKCPFYKPIRSEVEAEECGTMTIEVAKNHCDDSMEYIKSGKGLPPLNR
jgi:hypothetical protein